MTLSGVDVQERRDLQRDDGAYSMAEGLTGPGESCRVRIDDPLPTGYHGIRVTLTTPDREWIADQTRIVVPPRACTPQDLLPEPRAFGITVNLYTLASARNWGIGDMTDLEALAEWGAERGAVFVGVNPLHALLKRGNDVSPYSPVSRLYRNPLYIDVERVPELRRAPGIQERLASPELREELAALRESPTVPYGQAMGVKGLVLAALHRVFRSGNGTGSTDSARHAEFREYVEREGTALERFAIWMTIAESHGADWRQWPEPLRPTNLCEC